MKKFLKVLLLMVVVSMVSLSFMGCSPGGTTVKPDQGDSEKTSTASLVFEEELALKIYVVGELYNSIEDVLNEANKVFSQEINTTIDLQFIGPAEWGTQYQLLFSSGEEFDAIWTALWASYGQIAAKNGFMEITQDMLSSHAPMLLDDIPEKAWNEAKIGGKIFMVPFTFDQYHQRTFTVRGDLREKYNIEKLTSLDDLEKYLGAIKENESNMIPFSLSTDSNFEEVLRAMCGEPLGYWEINGAFSYMVPFRYNITASDVDIVNIYELPEFESLAERMYRWQQAGYINKDALASTEPIRNLFDNGKAAAYVYNDGNAQVSYKEALAKNPDWIVETYGSDWGKTVVSKAAYTESGIAINAKSKNPERVLTLTELARTDKDLNVLLTYGVEGKDWEDKGNNTVKLLTRPTDETRYFNTGGLNFMFRNGKYTKIEYDMSPMIVEMHQDWNNRIGKNILTAFNFDISNVKNEMAAMENVVTQYAKPLIGGMVDPEKGIPELRAKLKEAGAEKVVAELIEQAEAFMSSN